MRTLINPQRLPLFLIKKIRDNELSLRCRRIMNTVYISHPYHTLKRCNLQISNFDMVISSSATVHTTKGWKIIARTGQKSNEVTHSSNSLCVEDGSTAISHDALVAILQNCNSVQNQIDTFCSLTSISLEEAQRRNDFCHSLEHLFKPYINQYKIHPFGSSANGLGFRGCDLDISIQTNFTDNKIEEVILPSVPTLEEVLEGRVSSETVTSMKPRYLLRFLRRIIRKHCSDVKEPILLIKARCPILRFYNEKYDLFCDFSCENQPSLLNTKVLRLLGQLDARFIPLTKVLRYWAKYGGFVGDIEMFNSYAFSLLVLYFLQTTNPPVLPSIQEILSKSEYISKGDVNDVVGMLQDVKKFEPSQNRKTVDELLKEFFFYYLLNDFSRVMMPLTATSVSKFDFKPPKICPTDVFEMSSVMLQDPFRPGRNATVSAVYKYCLKFLNGLVQTCSTYQNEAVWNPNAPLWGLCSLFHKPIYEADTVEWQKNLNHFIEIPVTETNTAACILKDILRHGLMFKCTEFEIKSPNMNEHSQGQLLLKMTCLAYHNTWQGRSTVSVDHHNTESTLEKEHLISKELDQKRTDRRQILAQFLCEGIQTVKNGESYFVISLSFQESKFPPIVAIFLKEYIPLVLKKCLNESNVVLVDYMK